LLRDLTKAADLDAKATDANEPPPLVTPAIRDQAKAGSVSIKL
jgi:hypothetical protein